MKLKGLVPLLFSVIIGCAGHKEHIHFYDGMYHYYSLPIEGTIYYIIGKHKSKEGARETANKYLWMINEYCRPTLEDLRYVDSFGNIKGHIEGCELEKLREMIMVRNIKKST